MVLLAGISDIRCSKIKNGIVALFIMLGMITNVAMHGLIGLLYSLEGVLLPLLLLFVLYALRMLGAGDIKLFAAIGSIAGTALLLEIMVYAFISGGIIALFIMIFKRNGKARALYFIAYLRKCFYTSALLPYTVFGDNGEGEKFHFAVAIAVGTIIVLGSKYLNHYPVL